MQLECATMLRVIFACATVAVVLNVCVAWILAARADFSGDTIQSQQVDYCTGIYWSSQLHSVAGAECPTIVQFGIGSSSISDTESRHRWPDWVRKSDLPPYYPKGDHYCEIFASGWPTLCVRYKTHKSMAYSASTSGREPKVNSTSSGMIAISGLRNRGVVFPYAPIWLPFITNVLIYSAPLACLAMLYIKMRRCIRRAANKCEKCGYVLSGTSTHYCQECGSVCSS